MSHLFLHFVVLSILFVPQSLGQEISLADLTRWPGRQQSIEVPRSPEGSIQFVAYAFDFPTFIQGIDRLARRFRQGWERLDFMGMGGGLGYGFGGGFGAAGSDAGSSSDSGFSGGAGSPAFGR